MMKEKHLFPQYISYCFVIQQAPVVQRLDNSIHQISVHKANHTILWIVIYPMDRDIHLLNNQARPHLVISHTVS